MSRRPAFTMTSLLTLLAMLLLFLALLFPFIFTLRRSADRSMGMNNMRQLGIGAHNYHDVHGRLPPIVGKGRDGSGTYLMHMLPFLEQEPLFRQAKEDWTAVLARPLPLFVDPQDKTAPPGLIYKDWLATTNYPGNWMFFRDGDVSFANVTDGLSNTVMLTTRYQVCNGQPTGWAYNRLHYWAPVYGFYSRARFQIAPPAAECDPGLSQSLSPGGIATVFGDGSARFLSTSVSPQTWMFATDPADGNVVGDDLN